MAKPTEEQIVQVMHEHEREYITLWRFADVWFTPRAQEQNITIGQFLFWYLWDEEIRMIDDFHEASGAFRTARILWGQDGKDELMHNDGSKRWNYMLKLVAEAISQVVADDMRKCGEEQV